MADEILVVDDDGHIREVVRFALSEAGFRVREAHDGTSALEAFAAGGVKLVVLDLVMPSLDGLEVCRRIRKTSRVPIVFLSSKDEELDRVLGLELGADDYLGKPFSPRELVARVKAALRRYDEILELSSRAPKEESTGRIEHRGLVLDSDRHECLVDGALVPFTASEFALLRALIESPGRVLSRARLAEKAYGPAHFVSDRTIDSHVRRIRQKLGDAHAERIETVYGVGFRLRDEA